MDHLLLRTARFLEGRQYRTDGETYFRGEFPMTLTGPVSRTDHNFLSGYALLHLVMAMRHGRMPGEAQAIVAEMVDRARLLPGCYQTPAGLGNWYSGRGVGVPAPPAYPWPHDVMLCLRDDYDDTAISCLLTKLGAFEARIPFTPALFARAAYKPDVHSLVQKSVRRVDVAGGADGAYQSWAIDASPSQEDWQGHRGPHGHTGRIVWLPQENSIELTTAANVFSAIHLMDPTPTEFQVSTKRFVNRLTAFAVRKLLEGDASQLDFASSYYPRVPFAPLLFVVRDHVLTGGALLTDEVVDLIAEATRTVDPRAGWRQHDFANAAFWLGCCAWALAGSFLEKDRIADRVVDVVEELGPLMGEDGRWPDTVFFYEAHLGHYSGEPYVAAMLLETLALLLAADFA
jgi:hypothetical protein